MFGISGFARSGKDTFGEALVHILKEYGIKAKTFALATQLKRDISFLTESDFGISAFTNENSEKKIIRPLLVGYGESWRMANPDHWINLLNDCLRDNFEFLPIVTDIRYENEANFLLKNEGFLLNLNRQLLDGSYIEAPNNEEKINHPKVLDKCHWNLTWLTTDNQEEINQIVENFVACALENKIEKWKATYPL